MSNPLKRVATFFYGSFIRPDIMSLAGFEPSTIEVAKLSGYDICFDPHANVFRSGQQCVYGILVYPSHDQLEKLYRRDGVGTFLPEAVLVETRDNRFLPALCFMPPGRNQVPPDRQYIELIAAAARQHGFPAEYLSRLEALLR